MKRLMKFRYRLRAPMIAPLAASSPRRLQAAEILVLQPLRVPGGEAGEHEHADDADRELQRRAEPMKMFTRLAMMMPIRPMNRNEPMPVRSRLVV